MPRVYIGVGSNLGRRPEHIRRGLKMLEQRGFRIVKRSRIYETRPKNMANTGDFLNLAIAADTRHSPTRCLSEFRAVETALGRGRHLRNTPRTLDLDLLFYGNRIIHAPGVTIPHPRLHERAFVLKPLTDIAPGLVHPTMHQRVATLLKARSQEGIRRWKTR